MTIYPQVQPTVFVQPDRHLPTNGRGAWTKVGIGFDYRYRLATDPTQRIGTLAHQSLAHWAVAAGSHAIQTRLIELGHMGALTLGERGIFGPRTDQAVRTFQSGATDPESGARLVVDGIVGRSDARALFTPLIDVAADKHGIPDGLLRGQFNHESALDPGAIGFFIYYSTTSSATLEYRGVDRGPAQINSKAQPQVSWEHAFNYPHAVEWSAASMRNHRDQFAARYPTQNTLKLWEAAALAHNNPSAGWRYAATGIVPTQAAATYLNSVLAARY